ncbi:MAG: acyl-CoA dehydrogenase family protein [Smithella sp.]
MLNFTLTPDQLALQNNVREFAVKEILPLAWFYDEANELPSHIINKASEIGLMSRDMPKEYALPRPNRLWARTWPV